MKKKSKLYVYKNALLHLCGGWYTNFYCMTQGAQYFHCPACQIKFPSLLGAGFKIINTSKELLSETTVSWVYIGEEPISAMLLHKKDVQELSTIPIEFETAIKRPNIRR